MSQSRTRRPARARRASPRRAPPLISARCRKRPLEEQGRPLEQPAFRCSGDRLAEGEDRTGVRVLRADRVQPATVDPTEVVEPPKLRIEGLDQEPERPL